MNVTDSSLRVTVIGTGYLGLTHAVCMADLGHDVLAIDVDEEKIAKAAAGEAPFFEPGLEPLLRKNLDSGRLRFTTSFADIGEFGDVHFLCVGTPGDESGRARRTGPLRRRPSRSFPRPRRWRARRGRGRPCRRRG
jgi:UDP-glucose 6-dehydrogenase